MDQTFGYSRVELASRSCFASFIFCKHLEQRSRCRARYSMLITGISTRALIEANFHLVSSCPFLTLFPLDPPHAQALSHWSYRSCRPQHILAMFVSGLRMHTSFYEESNHWLQKQSSSKYDGVVFKTQWTKQSDDPCTEVFPRVFLGIWSSQII